MWTAENTYQMIKQILYNCEADCTVLIWKPQVISGGGAHPLHPPPRSAPESVYVFQTKNSTQWGDTYPYGLYREVPPLGRYDRNSCVPMKVQAVCVTMRFKIAQLMMMMKSLPKVCIVWGKCKCGFLKEILCVIFTKIQGWILSLKNSFSKWIY